MNQSIKITFKGSEKSTGEIVSQHIVADSIAGFDLSSNLSKKQIKNNFYKFLKKSVSISCSGKRYNRIKIDTKNIESYEFI